MAVLINSNISQPVKAQDDADLFAALIGPSGGILQVGQQMAASIQSSNVVRLADGEFVTKEGRRIRIRPGTYDDFTIPNGVQGRTTYYVIGYRIYVDSDSIQQIEQFINTYTSRSTVPTESTLRSGASEVYVSLYRVTQVSMDITAVSALKSVAGRLSEIKTVDNKYEDRYLQTGITAETTPTASGYITNSKTRLVFMLHPAKQLSPSVNAVAVYACYMTIRQNGVYLYGAAGSPAAVAPGEITVYRTGFGWRCEWQRPNNKVINDKAVNNAGCEIEMRIRFRLT